MPRQDADTPRVRGPLRSEPSRSDPSHTAPYSWTSIPQLQDTRFPLGMLPRIAYHGSCSYQQTTPPHAQTTCPTALYIPCNPRYLPPKHHTPSATPHTHGCRRRLSHHNLKTGQPRRRPRRAPLVRARLSLPLCQIICYSAIDSNHESRAPAEFLTTRQQLTGRTRVRFAGSQKARVRSSLRVSTRPRSASSSRRTPRWKRGHRRTTTKAY